MVETLAKAAGGDLSLMRRGQARPPRLVVPARESNKTSLPATRKKSASTPFSPLLHALILLHKTRGIAPSLSFPSALVIAYQFLSQVPLKLFLPVFQL